MIKFDIILQFDWLSGFVFIVNSKISSVWELYFKITMPWSPLLSFRVMTESWRNLQALQHTILKPKHEWRTPILVKKLLIQFLPDKATEFSLNYLWGWITHVKCLNQMTSDLLKFMQYSRFFQTSVSKFFFFNFDWLCMKMNLSLYICLNQKTLFCQPPFRCFHPTLADLADIDNNVFKWKPWQSAKTNYFHKLSLFIKKYREDITRWCEHMKFIFEWKKSFKSERSEQVKSFFHKKINFICSSQRAIFFLLHRYECFENEKY